METLVQVVYGVAGIALLYYGAEGLIRGGVSIARRLGISSLVIGLTLVAFGTSAPELCVSVDAALSGSGDISLGNVVGSNICNIALILGLSAMLSPLRVHRELLKLDVPVMLGSTLALVTFYAMNRGVERWQASVFLVGLLTYVWWNLRQRRQSGAEQEEASASQAVQPVMLSLLRVILGLAGLVFGAKLFVGSAVYVARLFEVSEAVIGLTIVAVGTSLPELATSAVAAYKGETDIAVGNAVGSNIFNVLCILGIAPLVSPIHSPGMSMVDMWLMVGLCVLLYPFMKLDLRISRREGATLMVIYLVYVGWLVSRS